MSSDPLISVAEQGGEYYFVDILKLYPKKLNPKVTISYSYLCKVKSLSEIICGGFLNPHKAYWTEFTSEKYLHQ